MPAKGMPVVVIDRYTMKRIARYQSVREAADDLSIPANTIYQCLSSRVASYDAYFAYEHELPGWKPSKRSWMRVNGLKVSARLEELKGKML